ncbi:hypothetical protein [Pseudaestuariivita rosea]|uniref:hypothetical protein n=1 Tax=Pseudaestuariivita rosea TaxID=2763263 RepID=UPI001ABAD3FB|nr:hypothetical protein [Pseudaestuariivita rosea]
MDFSDPFKMIAQGLSTMAENKRQSYQNNMDILARYEKRAAWKSDTWTYWDFETAPEERALLDGQKLTKRQVEQRSQEWIAKDAKTKPPLIRLIEKGSHDGMADRVRALVEDGEDPNGATLLKDTPLSYARYWGYDDIFDLLIELGADGEKAGFSKLHHAVRYGTITDVAPLIGTFDILWKNFDATSVLHEAVTADKPDVVAALLDQIAAEGRIEDDETALCFSLAVSLKKAKVLDVFLQDDLRSEIALDATLETFDTDMLKTLLKHGADVHQISTFLLFHNDPLHVLDKNGRPAIIEYVRTLVDAGWSVEDLFEYERAQIRYVTEAYRIPPQDISSPDFLEGAKMCSGTANPEERTLPYHLEMLRTGESSDLARQRMTDLPYGVWSADRFGQSTTRLPDGRWVQIGGEHEDSYDPDFVIFSDVVVQGPGNDVRIFFYPASVFPPTDFHTATLIDDAIWIIGGLGYASDRQDGVTPVFRLDLADFSMHRVQTSGDAPGWISRHRAQVHGSRITVSGGKVSVRGQYWDLSGNYVLDTQTGRWTQLT